MAESTENLMRSRTVQYDTVIKPVRTTVQYSKEEAVELFSHFPDLIPNKDYYPWYRRRLIVIGYERFMELVPKARAGSDTPAILFKWMLQNPDEVN